MLQCGWDYSRLLPGKTRRATIVFVMMAMLSTTVWRPSERALQVAGGEFLDRGARLASADFNSFLRE
jgi:hypothetical protein